MSKTTSYARKKYLVNTVPNFKLSEALQLWKTKYQGDFNEFAKDTLSHPALSDFKDFVSEMWDDVNQVTVEQALKIGNLERRRVYFDCIGVEKLFNELDPTLLDRQVIKKKRKKWDDANDPYDYEFEDVYELYRIEREKLFQTGEDDLGSRGDAYAVRCWCTTTNREYWIYVPSNIGERHTVVFNEDTLRYDMIKYHDAVEAIAWTIRMNVRFPERIYRQGDIIVAKYCDDSIEMSYDYHLSKEDYLQLMYSET